MHQGERQIEASKTCLQRLLDMDKDLCYQPGPSRVSFRWGYGVCDNRGWNELICVTYIEYKNQGAGGKRVIMYP